MYCTYNRNIFLMHTYRPVITLCQGQ